MTIIDRHQIVDAPDPDFGGISNRGRSHDQLRDAYKGALRGFDYFGMIEPALYVSTQRVAGVPRFMLWHMHALVWNTSRERLERRAEDLRPWFRAYLPYATGVDVRPVRTGDLLQMIWYVAKTPMHQYQLAKRESESLQQYRGPLNGVNTVRLYAAMHELQLPDLVLAGGIGCHILRRTCRAARHW
ncbi:hypothetical protein FF100_34775 [Methylobacterium terricola]|uniref:Uncharacterized protein n=1 Tax=Methylobacterium terricola TaxID=2583531 RepID=A0A5C4L574_9HYPH|nr:hypothetical protein [Methylobacterium terricola]TNC06263.1 hypothetical protein FF100_34775 [Methylobacterium terricola]